MLGVLLLVYVHHNLRSAGSIQRLPGAGVTGCLSLRGDIGAPPSVEVAESLVEDDRLGVGKLEDLVRVVDVVLQLGASERSLRSIERLLRYLGHIMWYRCRRCHICTDRDVWLPVYRNMASVEHLRDLIFLLHPRFYYSFLNQDFTQLCKFTPILF